MAASSWMMEFGIDDLDTISRTRLEEEQGRNRQSPSPASSFSNSRRSPPPQTASSSSSSYYYSKEKSNKSKNKIEDIRFVPPPSEHGAYFCSQNLIDGSQHFERRHFFEHERMKSFGYRNQHQQHSSDDRSSIRRPSNNDTDYERNNSNYNLSYDDNHYHHQQQQPHSHQQPQSPRKYEQDDSYSYKHSPQRSSSYPISPSRHYDYTRRRLSARGGHSSPYSSYSTDSRQFTSSRRHLPIPPPPCHHQHSPSSSPNHASLRRHRRTSFSSTTSSTESTTTHMEIEVAPGIVMRLRGAKETKQALQDGFVLRCDCLACQESILCIATAEYVLCPTCRVINPVQDSIGTNEVDGGVGLGIAIKELSGSEQRQFLLK